MAVAGVPDTRQGRNADVVNQRIGRDRATGLAMTGGGETGLRQCRRIIALPIPSSASPLSWRTPI